MMTIVRMDKERMMKRIRKWRQIAGRMIGKRRIRWEVDGADLGKMKIQNWSKMLIDREAWTRNVQQAKTYRSYSAKKRRRKNKKSIMTMVFNRQKDKHQARKYKYIYRIERRLVKK